MWAVIDTNVLIASFLDAHPHHASSYRLVQKILDGSLKAAVSTHTLAECYSTLTSYPLLVRVTPEAAERLLTESVLPHFKMIDLSARDYREAIRRVRARNLRSGAIFDALVVQAALKKKVKILYTWNLRDFERLTEPSLKILEPNS